MFFQFFTGLYKGHCCELDFSSSSELSFSQSVSTGLSLPQLIFDIWYVIKFFIVLL